MKQTSAKVAYPKTPADWSGEEIVTASEIQSRAIGHGDPAVDLHNALWRLGAEKRQRPTHYRKMVQGTGFQLTRKTLDIWWGGYAYSIDLDEIDTPPKLIATLAHIGQKTWPGMTPSRISALIQALDKRFGWNIWRAG